VVKVGEAVTEFAEGDDVAIYLGVGCGVCHHCRTGHFYLCPKWKCLGFTMDGGNAEFLRVPARNLLKTPKGMSHLAAAVSTDAFGTLFSASRKLGVSGLSRVGIWGMGPMGAAGTLAVKAMGGRIVALDPIEERRDFALSLGADLALDPRDATAIDCSGSPVAHNMALDALAPMGKLALVGEAASTTIKPSDQLIRKQVTVFGSWYFGIDEYADILQLIETHRIDLERLATHTFALEEAETAFRMFDNRETEKAVFVR
jgi:propanol-preferring alcohol dehydrogenase